MTDPVSIHALILAGFVMILAARLFMKGGR